MKSESVIRRDSTISIYESTRQRLRNPNTRRIYVVGKNPDINEVDASNLTDTPQSIIKTDVNQQQEFPLRSLKQLVSKKKEEKIIEVQIRCIFLRIADIDTLNERFNAELLLEASWETTTLNTLQNRSFDPSIDWTPKLELLNGIGQVTDEITYTVRFIKQDLVRVIEHHQLKGTLWERMELQDFPMDIQRLSILTTTPCTNSEMIFVKNFKQPSGVYRRVFMDEDEWYLFEHVDITITDQIDEYLDNEHNHSVVICSCHVARKYGYFMWNAYFLIFLITSASFTTFPIPLANVQGRAITACTLLLTSITFRWSCNKFLPQISYLTALDAYAIGSIFSLCLLNIFHGVIGYVNYYISTNTNSNSTTITSDPNLVVIDRWALVVFTILFFAYQIGTIIWMYFVPGRKRRLMLKKDEQNRLHITKHFNNIKATFLDVLLRTKQSIKFKNNRLINS